MKLSFSIPPKSKSKVRPISDKKNIVDEDIPKEFVTKFDPSETLTDSKPNYVIPPLQNTWNPHKETNKNIDLLVQSTSEHVEEMLLRKDLESLPDEPTLEDFENVPVEGFGYAVLAGYGWKPGQGMGLIAKEDVQSVQCKKWIGNEGLGFDFLRTRPSGNAKGK